VRAGNFCLSYGERDLTSSTLRSNGVVVQSTPFVLGGVLRGSPSQGEGGGTVDGGPGSGGSLDTGSTAGIANAGLIGEEGGTEKVTRKKSKSRAEHKAEWRKGKGNVEKELTQKERGTREKDWRSRKHRVQKGTQSGARKKPMWRRSWPPKKGKAHGSKEEVSTKCRAKYRLA